jgi:hypothetical protein
LEKIVFLEKLFCSLQIQQTYDYLKKSQQKLSQLIIFSLPSYTKPNLNFGGLLGKLMQKVKDVYQAKASKTQTCYWCFI